MSEAKIVYITKYWQTKGILMMDSLKPTIVGGVRVQMDSNDYYHNTTTLFFGSDCWSNREDAIAHVEKCREKRIKSLEKQLEKLRNLVVADTVVDCRKTDNKGGTI